MDEVWTESDMIAAGGAMAGLHRYGLLNPGVPDPYCNAGLIHERKREWSKALATFEQCLQLIPATPEYKALRITVQDMLEKLRRVLSSPGRTL